MDIQTIAIYGVGFIVAMILLKFIIKIPFMLLKYAILAAIIYAAYLLYSGQM